MSSGETKRNGSHEQHTNEGELFVFSGKPQNERHESGIVITVDKETRRNISNENSPLFKLK